MKIQSFSDLLSAVQLKEQTNQTGSASPDEAVQAYSAKISADWLQGRTAFGGILAALAVRAISLSQETTRPLRSLMTAFVGPVVEGTFEIRTRHLRSGRSASWWQAEIIQDDAIKTTLTACLGEDRPSGVHVKPPTQSHAATPESLESLPFVPNLVPNFTQHFEMRWAIGQPPMSAGKGSEMGAWVRFREPGLFSKPHLVALMDLLPPAIMQQLDSFKPVSSLTWHLSFLESMDNVESIRKDAWWFFHVHAQSAKDGYSQQEATLFNDQGKAIAISQQSIAVFDQ